MFTEWVPAMKEYKIRTIDDLLKVPEKHLDDCLEHIGEAVRAMRETQKAVREVARCTGEKAEFGMGCICYKPDGKKHITLMFK